MGRGKRRVSRMSPDALHNLLIDEEIGSFFTYPSDVSARCPGMVGKE